MATYEKYLSWAVYLLVVGYCYLVARSVYRIFFDSLSKFPGPRIAAISEIYWQYHTLTGQKAAKARQLHLKYGEVVRIGPNELSFIGETSWQDIYGHKQGRKQLEKADKFPFTVRGVPTYNILNAPDDIHSRQRKMVSHAFSDRALREQEPLLKQYIDMMMDNLHQDAQDGKVANMVKYYNYTTFDFIGDFALAQSFDNLRLRKDHPFLTLLFENLITFVVVQALVATFPPLYRILMSLRSLTMTYDFEGFIHKNITKRIENGDRQRPDLMSGILKHAMEDGTGISRDEIEATATVLVTAGSETTATLLSGATYLLLCNPKALARLMQEIRTAFRHSEDINIQELNKLPFLSAVLQESLRLYPPVPIAFPRVTPPEGISICGYYVPGKVIVGVPQYAAYTNPSNFTDPLSFIPERHLSDRPAAYENDKLVVLQPFSFGPRNCVGRNLAYMEMKLILARVVYDFDLELLETSQSWSQQRVFTLWEKPPLMVRLRCRV